MWSQTTESSDSVDASPRTAPLPRAEGPRAAASDSRREKKKTHASRDVGANFRRGMRRARASEVRVVNFSGARCRRSARRASPSAPLLPDTTRHASGESRPRAVADRAPSRVSRENMEPRVWCVFFGSFVWMRAQPRRRTNALLRLLSRLLASRERAERHGTRRVCASRTKRESWYDPFLRVAHEKKGRRPVPVLRGAMHSRECLEMQLF